MSTRKERAVALREASKLAQIVDRCHTTLKVISAGIWRDEDRNACGLSGGAAAVHAVEESLQEIEDYIEGKA